MIRNNNQTNPQRSPSAMHHVALWRSGGQNLKDLQHNKPMSWNGAQSSKGLGETRVMSRNMAKSTRAVRNTAKFGGSSWHHQPGDEINQSEAQSYNLSQSEERGNKSRWGDSLNHSREQNDSLSRSREQNNSLRRRQEQNNSLSGAEASGAMSSAMEMSKFVLLAVVIVLQVCLTMADVSADASESQGVLERPKEAYKDLRARVVDAGSTAFEFLHMYYEDQVKPLTDKYTEWAQEKARSIWDTVKDKVSSDESG